MSYPYKRQVLYKNKDVEVVLITWPAKAISLAHDHGRSSGLIRVIKGSVYQDVYSKKTKRLIKKLIYRTNDIILENPELIHIMGNNSKTSIAQTLHVYTPPLTMKVYTDKELKIKK